MNILYYNEPTSSESGPNGVAYNLTKTLSKKIDVTFFPRFNSRVWTINMLGILRSYVSNKFDIIHFNMLPIWSNGSYLLLSSATHRKIPTIFNIHGLIAVEHAFEPQNRPMPALDWINFYNSCHLADKIIANSEYMKGAIVSTYKADPRKVEVIPNGVDCKKFANCSSRVKLSGDPAILSVGAVCILKGFGTMVDAVDRLRHDWPNMKLHFVGRADKEYRDLAKQKGVEEYLVFHGLVPHETIPSYLQSAEMGIFGSTVYEGFGMALVEAMASGLPVIASDIDTYRQIVTDGQDGLIFKRNNPNSLSKAITLMASDSTLRKKISQNAKQTAASYDWEKIADKYTSLYSKLLID